MPQLLKRRITKKKKFEQAEVDRNHAETITFLRKKLVIGYDAPSAAYLADPTLKTDVVMI